MPVPAPGASNTVILPFALRWKPCPTDPESKTTPVMSPASFSEYATVPCWNPVPAPCALNMVIDCAVAAWGKAEIANPISKARAVRGAMAAAEDLFGIFSRLHEYIHQGERPTETSPAHSS